MIESIHGVSTFCWNPRKLSRRRVLHRFDVGPRIDNFGDLIGPVVVELLARRVLEGRDPSPTTGTTLLSVGSVMHFARPGDVVWGTGLNGKTAVPTVGALDIRAVRGPVTAALMREAGHRVPDVYGDPALLLPRLMPDLRRTNSTKPGSAPLLVPNLHDLGEWRRRYGARFDVLDPTRPLMECLKRIASSSAVVASSLHGVVIADALGIEARLVAASAEPPLKYIDHLRSTGRDLPDPLPVSVEEALAADPLAEPSWDPEPLLAAFPSDLWLMGEAA